MAARLRTTPSEQSLAVVGADFVCDVVELASGESSPLATSRSNVRFDP